jgi:hypothetical protein
MVISLIIAMCSNKTKMWRCALIGTVVYTTIVSLCLVGKWRYPLWRYIYSLALFNAQVVWFPVGIATIFKLRKWGLMRVAVAVVIWWMTYSFGYFNGGLGKQQDVERQQRVERIVGRAGPIPADAGSRKIYAQKYEAVYGTVNPYENHWDIHMAGNIPVFGHLVRDGTDTTS